MQMSEHSRSIIDKSYSHSHLPAGLEFGYGRKPRNKEPKRFKFIGFLPPYHTQVITYRREVYKFANLLDLLLPSGLLFNL